VKIIRSVSLRCSALSLVLAIAACRGAASGPASVAVIDAVTPGARVSFPHRPAGCGYDVRPPHAGHLAVAAHDPAARATAPRHLHLTAVGDASTSMVVQWNTDLGDRSAAVRVRAVGERAWRRVTGYSFLLPGARGVRHHEVHLCGLAPGARYEYAVDAPGARAWSFHTAPEAPTEVVAMVAGDARTNPAVWGAVAAAAATHAPELLLFTGDAVADGGSFALWARFFEVAEALFATTPGFWVDGNHEGLAAVYYDQFAFPENGDTDHHEHWYAATWGPLRVIGLNDVTVREDVIRGAERDFLARSLAAVDRARTPWVLTMHHQPMHTDAVGHLPDAATRDAWGPLLDRFHVDLDLSGHVHNYESTEPMRSDGAVTADGTRYFVYGGAGAPLYPFRERGPWVHARESTHGFAMLRADAQRILWEAFRVDGSRIEAITVPRRGGETAVAQRAR
jgi:hypothetical protein